jgi:NAD+ synthase
VGYSTKYGDAAGDFSLLNRLTKTEVIELGDYMNLPKELVHKTPSDGMCGKTDEDNLGFTYEVLDNYILNKVPPKSLEVFSKIIKMHNNPNTKYKCVDMPSALEDIRSAAPEFVM